MKSIVMAALLLAGTASSALAAGPYIGASTGLTIFSDSDLDRGGYTDTIGYDAGPAVNVALGYNFGGARVEGEYGYKHADVSDVSGYQANGMDATVQSAMANILFDFTPMRVATPVLGVGFGALFGNFKDHEYGYDNSYHDTRPGYQVTVGVAFKLGSRVNLDASYRLQGAFSDFEVGGSKVSYLSSNLLVGARYNF